ncbi:eukaryotic translation elongation factor 1 gamma [Cyanidioschyzon merolae strain 10D]|jgi:elongation factor 1-gamma|uniref:Eukaryotic translation elongation factor 1 gamma n=1 Tax=Cyanidioschyzon merolae (strain NIES-3377 / 10D) TaxID=280699 RepID=M1V8T1_CYAM1|nr:eukaryotic translation elongation factor 1 gamma [Cyanidioschyzon merolae strain 10D]BAM80904.1 eukaryotic translation elongation factor 1 gamma [Cyanidioschyzon merolae strain 10D]|eukprot:XP_005536940.1 eukaryotic translation elongation factor 1 gamma [Cyanidioschyzon merolae strain 10D]
MKLYTYPNNPRAYKALIAAQYCGAEVQVPPDFKFLEDNRKPEFLRLNPFGQVPLLDLGDGKAVFESNAIARYILESSNRQDMLGGDDAVQRAQVAAFGDVALGRIDPLGRPLVYPTIFPAFFKPDKTRFEEALEQFRAVIGGFERHLTDHTFLVGERITLADITVSMSLFWFFEYLLDPELLMEYRALKRWFYTCIGQPEFVKVIGSDFKPCLKRPDHLKMATSTNADLGGHAGNQGHESSDHAAEVTEDDQTARKPKNAFDLLPKSSFNLEAAKRLYSNADNTREVMNQIWDTMFDPSGYSVWVVRYRYNHELSKTFMSANLLNGWFQRMDHLRKYLFGSMIVFGTSGEPGSCAIGGAFIVRGTGDSLPEPLTEVEDTDLYTWTKADVFGKDRDLVNDLFAWEGKFEGMGPDYDGKPVATGKNFK